MRYATLALFASAALTAPVAAQTTQHLTLRPESKLSVDGTSNLHAWTCAATTLEGSLDVVVTPAAPLAKLQRVDVKVPVTSLKCGHGGMDKNLYKAIDADANPTISYTLTSVEIVPGSADSYTVKAVGKLTIAGTTNTIDMDVTAQRLGDGTFRATGAVPLQMTDYGIKPPTAMFGTLKTGNAVTVKFELVAAPGTAVAVNVQQ